MCVRERRGSVLFGAEVPPLLRGCSVQWQHLCHFFTSFPLLFFLHSHQSNQPSHACHPPPQGDAAQLPLSDYTSPKSALEDGAGDSEPTCGAWRPNGRCGWCSQWETVVKIDGWSARGCGEP